MHSYPIVYCFFFVSKLTLRKTFTALYNLREMMVIMDPMEIPINRYCNYFHMITDVEKFASPYLLYYKFTLLLTNSIQSLFFT